MKEPLLFDGTEPEPPFVPHCHANALKPGPNRSTTPGPFEGHRMAVWVGLGVIAAVVVWLMFL